MAGEGGQITVFAVVVMTALLVASLVYDGGEALAWLIVRVRSPAALRLATISARTASTAPSRPFGAPWARPD
jgi:uncharacterized membrane protein